MTRLALAGYGGVASRDVLVGNEDLPAADDLSERNRLVGLPVTDCLG